MTKKSSCKLFKYIMLFSMFFMLSACNNDNAANANVVTTSDNITTPTPAPTDLVQQQKQLISTLISRYPQGSQGRNTPLTIQFRQPIIKAEQIGQTADQYITILPKIAGKAILDGLDTLIFKPDEAFASGQEYTINLMPNGLLNIPAKTPTLSFAFQTPKLELDVKTEGLSITPEQQFRLQGTLFSSDFIASEQAEKVLQATLQNQPLNIQWEHNLTGTEHRFSIDKITRETFATDLALAWDGAAIKAQGEQSKGKQEITIPSKTTFSITRIAVLNDTAEAKPHIEISFSDALNNAQDLTGLVQLGENKIRTQVIANRLLVYPTEELSTGKHQLVIHEGIQSANRTLGKLSKRVVENITLEPPKPAVRFVAKGTILPDNQTMEVPIEARAVKAVRVTAMEIYPDNIAQFLQTNGLNGEMEKERVGRYLWRKTLPLTSANPNQWNRYTLDVSQLLKTKPGSLYRLELEVERQHTSYPCSANNIPVAETAISNYEDEGSNEKSGWDGISDYYLNSDQENSGDYTWEKRDDPCDDSYYYYNSEKVNDSHNVLASNLGLIAKQETDGTLRVITTDLRNATPATQVALTVRNFQGQTLATAQSDAQGFATISLKDTPFLLVAKQGQDTAYLKLNANTSLAISQFEVGGEFIKKGLKGYIYGERSVWRPGDTIYLSFVLQDRTNSLPSNHPVTVQLIDPTGKVKQAITTKTATGPFYTFTLKTAQTDPTGNWLAKVFVGGSTFDKTLKIETIRPNRLKVELDYGTEALYGYEPLPTAKLFGQWLHGGTAANLKADVSVRLREKSTTFDRFNDYQFDDPTRKLDGEEQQLLEGRLDENGYLRFQKDFQPKQLAPGMLSAWFTSRVHENTGGFSISKQTQNYYPYQNYVGIKLPKGDAERGMLLTDVDHQLNIASLDAKGNTVSLPQVEVTLYKIEWKWWWDKTPESLAEYTDGSNSKPLQKTIISTKDGQGSWQFQIKYPDWGRYLIRACDLEGKHCTGKTLYVDWPGWAGRAQEESGGAASMLRFTSDKTDYQVGETAQIQLPEAQAGRALLTVETSSRILEQRWIEFNGERTQIDLPITAAMTPNAYISISLLQAHQNKQNDRPLRLYGIIPINVSDPETLLNPVITAAEEWKPEAENRFTISEKNGKPMYYTLAVVDEGLLGLTRHSVDDLHQAFYTKEALGIETWDLFDDVIGAYNGKLERMLALGGGDEVQLDDAANKPKRFPPVVRFLGAFSLEAGQTQEHNITLPPYLGAVRIMLVAAKDQAYGKAEQSVFVRQPLMMLSSLPRSLKVNESLDVPLTLFVSNDEIKQVDIRVEADTAFSNGNEPTTTRLDFAQQGEKVTILRIKAGTIPKQGKLRFTASSGEYTSSHEVNLMIQAPNLPTQRLKQFTLAPSSDWKTSTEPFGLAGSNQASLSLSSLPNLSLQQHLDYLINYPHGCLEQTTSAVFPQLYLPKLLKLEEKQQQRIEAYIKQAISKLERFQNAAGDLTYWPGDGEENAWASLYAGHFLLEAQRQGYHVPVSLLSAWLAYQERQAQQWVTNKQSIEKSPIQAYRLYTLALAEKPALGAMNRLREANTMIPQARWLLAAAYQQAGHPDAAKQITSGLVPSDIPAATTDLNFNTELGQLGLQLATLLTLDKPQDAALLVEKIATALASETRFNTHDLAWALVSLGHYLQQQGKTVSAQLSLANGEPQTLTGQYSLIRHDLAPSDVAVPLTLRNDNAFPLYVTLLQNGIATAQQEQAASNGLQIQRRLVDSKGVTVWKEGAQLATPPLQLAQGQDYTLITTLSNQSKQVLRHIALSTLLPSGVELTEARVKDIQNYQDLRDNQVLSYIDLKVQQEAEITAVFNAAYLGDYYFPASMSEVMYQPSINANTIGFPVSIVKTLKADANNTLESPTTPASTKPVEAEADPKAKSS